MYVLSGGKGGRRKKKAQSKKNIRTPLSLLVTILPASLTCIFGETHGKFFFMHWASIQYVMAQKFLDSNFVPFVDTFGCHAIPSPPFLLCALAFTFLLVPFQAIGRCGVVKTCAGLQ